MRYVVVRVLNERLRVYGPFEDHATAWEFAHNKEEEGKEFVEKNPLWSLATYHIVSLEEVD